MKCSFSLPGRSAVSSRLSQDERRSLEPPAATAAAVQSGEGARRQKCRAQVSLFFSPSFSSILPPSSPPVQVFVVGSLEVNETQQPQHPINVYHELGVTRNKIVSAQFECYQKIIKDTPNSREGASGSLRSALSAGAGEPLHASSAAPPAAAEPMCDRTWDGWLCWDDTKPGVSEQHCPDYFQDFDPSGGTLASQQTSRLFEAFSLHTVQKLLFVFVFKKTPMSVHTFFTIVQP